MMLQQTSTAPGNSRQAIGFLALQIVLISAGVAIASWRIEQRTASFRLPELLALPRKVTPLYDNPVVVSDEQLRRVLLKLRPRNLGDKTRINHIDHALRFWGVEAKFDDAQFFDGADLRRILTDNRRFQEIYGPTASPLLIDSEQGVRIRTQEGVRTASHVDHTLASLAEVGTPLDFPLVTANRTTSYRALVEQTLYDFTLNQVEYEWSAVTFAMFFAPNAQFATNERQFVTFDTLARRIMRQELPQGVCFGNHRLYGLVVLLRLDQQGNLLSAAMNREVVEFLQGMTKRLVNSQHADGYWDGNWPAETRAADGERTSGDALADRILATGHALEWWAMAPAELHPPRDTLARAGQWLVRTIDDLTPERTEEYYTYLSHAGRALSIWRGRWPHEVLAAGNAY